MASLHAVIAASVLLIYTSGSMLSLLSATAILTKTEWKESPGLVLITTLAFSDMCMSFPSMLGSVESLLGYRLFRHSSQMIGFLGYFSWASASVHMVVLSVNRFIAIQYPDKYGLWCSGTITRCTVIAIFAFALIHACIGQWIGYPCIWSHQLVMPTFDYARNVSFPGMLNVAHITTAVCVFVPAVCYIVVTVNLVRMYMSSQAALGSQSQAEISMCWQFLVVLVAYLNMEVFFYTLPFVEGLDPKYLFVMSYGVAINYTVNGFVYLVFNKTIRKAAKQLLCGNRVAPATQQPTGTKRRIGNPNVNATQM